MHEVHYPIAQDKLQLAQKLIDPFWANQIDDWKGLGAAPDGCPQWVRPKNK